MDGTKALKKKNVNAIKLALEKGGGGNKINSFHLKETRLKNLFHKQQYAMLLARGYGDI